MKEGREGRIKRGGQEGEGINSRQNLDTSETKHTTTARLTMYK